MGRQIRWADKMSTLDDDGIDIGPMVRIYPLCDIGTPCIELQGMPVSAWLAVI